MRKPGEATGKASSAAAKPSSKSVGGIMSAAAAKPSSKSVGGVKSCRNCRNGMAPCLCRGSVNFGLCCNCLDTESRGWRTCMNRCLPSDMSTDGESSYESPQRLPDPYIQELQIKQLQQRYKALDSRIDFLRENQEAMSRQINNLKKEVAANNSKIKKP